MICHLWTWSLQELLSSRHELVTDTGESLFQIMKLRLPGVLPLAQNILHLVLCDDCNSAVPRSAAAAAWPGALRIALCRWASLTMTTLTISNAIVDACGVPACCRRGVRHADAGAVREHWLVGGRSAGPGGSAQRQRPPRGGRHRRRRLPDDRPGGAGHLFCFLPCVAPRGAALLRLTSEFDRETPPWSCVRPSWYVKSAV